MNIIFLSNNDWGGANFLMSKGINMLTEHHAESITEDYHPFEYDTGTVISSLKDAQLHEVKKRIEFADFLYIAQDIPKTFAKTISAVLSNGSMPFLFRHSGSDIRNTADNRFEFQLADKYYWSFTAYDYSMTRCLIQSLQHNTHIIDTDKWKPKLKQEDNDDSIFIYHSPTNNEYKGTKYISEAIEKLSRKYNIRWRHTGCKPTGEGSVSWQTVMNEKSKADIFIDSIRDEAHGQNTAEAMCMGIPTLTSVGPYYRSIYPDTPIVNTNIHNIEDNLEKLLLDPEKRLSIGRKTREYAVNTFSIIRRIKMWAPIIEFISHPDIHDKWKKPSYWETRGPNW